MKTISQMPASVHFHGIPFVENGVTAQQIREVVGARYAVTHTLLGYPQQLPIARAFGGVYTAPSGAQYDMRDIGRRARRSVFAMHFNPNNKRSLLIVVFDTWCAVYKPTNGI